VEDVVFDGNVPSSVAIKVNEAVEYDRFGNQYYTHRYVYEPTIQRFTINGNQQIQRRLLRKPRHKGMRYIREINNENDYPQRQFHQTFPTQNMDNLQFMVNSQYNLHSFPTTVHHFTAHALPNDPMRFY
jgi:hypothetical protein